MSGLGQGPSTGPMVWVHLLPCLTSQAELAGQAVVVIDVLRASTTVIAALAAGAAQIIPCLEVNEAISLSRARPGSLKGGERHGQRIDGFELSNSPREYLPQRVKGRTIVFTTTNGTRALAACLAAEPVWLGAFANLSAVVRAAARENRVHLLCAGTEGQASREDVLLAGAAVARLLERGFQPANDSALMASDLWGDLVRRGAAGRLPDELLCSQGGRNLVQLGMQSDVAWAAVIDRFDCLPRLDRSSWSIRPS